MSVLEVLETNQTIFIHFLLRILFFQSGPSLMFDLKLNRTLYRFPNRSALPSLGRVDRPPVYCSVLQRFEAPYLVFGSLNARANKH